MIKIKLNRNLLFILWTSFVCIQCNPSGEGQYSYSIKRLQNTPEINCDWNKEIWKKTRPITLENFMGERPDHFPVTKAKVSYDEDYIYVIFRVWDQYVKAVAKKTQGRVWEDSCVEFFFSPGPDVDRGYFNFEANCKGVFLFKYSYDNGLTKHFVDAKDCDKIKISHSLERNVEQEIQDPVEWLVEYSIPFSVLSKYMEVEKPGPGVSWRANFYKCADKTSHPHWLTWAPVDFPEPKFHLPEFFGRLDFE
jgi:hypothetical protein